MQRLISTQRFFHHMASLNVVFLWTDVLKFPLKSLFIVFDYRLFFSENTLVSSVLSLFKKNPAVVMKQSEGVNIAKC